jgi:hypothetical protein
VYLVVQTLDSPDPTFEKLEMLILADGHLFNNFHSDGGLAIAAGGEKS